MLKKNLAVTLCALIISTPITQALAAGEAERPGVPAVPAVPAAGASIVGHTLPQDPADGVVDARHRHPPGGDQRLEVGDEFAKAQRVVAELTIPLKTDARGGDAQNRIVKIHGSLGFFSPTGNASLRRPTRTT